MLLLIKPALNHHMTGLMHCVTHKFLKTFCPRLNIRSPSNLWKMVVLIYLFAPLFFKGRLTPIMRFIQQDTFYNNFIIIVLFCFFCFFTIFVKILPRHNILQSKWWAHELVLLHSHCIGEIMYKRKKPINIGYVLVEMFILGFSHISQDEARWQHSTLIHYLFPLVLRRLSSSVCSFQKTNLKATCNGFHSKKKKKRKYNWQIHT